MVGSINLTVPLSTEDVLSLKSGDFVLLSGKIVTGRDRIHKFLLEQKPHQDEIPFHLAGTVLYHCGPLIQKSGEERKIIAAGPTTSMRVEMYAAEIIKEYGIKGLIGKGGMGKKTLQALQESSCVYFHTIGGAAVYLADRIKKVLGVWKLDEFGAAEAMWHLEVENFPAIVTMDSHGNDIHHDIEHMSLRKFAEFIAEENRQSAI
jgi:fumarate hydratase class I